MLLALILLGIFGTYFLINIGRLFAKRIHKEYLRHAWKKTALWLIALQILTIVLGYAAIQLHITLLSGVYLLATTQLIIAGVILATTYLNIRHAKPPKITLDITDPDLPTVTVCIPARNETQDLEECLLSLVASDYPKLEILVLDDCSQERRTPEIIRSFAQDGVRFIAGKEPPPSWLAKNYAYDQLADEANGELLLFCGVDTRFKLETVSNLVRLLKQTNKSMLSVLPRNVIKSGPVFGQSLIQPARYAWELALPRQVTNRPPVLSTCWMVVRNELESVGGFNAISQKCVPESFFARSIAQKLKYSFIISDDSIGLTASKTIASQRATAIRTRYPQLHRRPELVALLSIAEIAQLFWPAIIFAAASFQGNTLLTVLSGLATFCNFLVYSIMTNLAYRRFVVSGLLSLPFAALYDVCLLNYSMWQYEFGKVIWKDRDICTPVMQVIPKLPRV